MSCKAKISDLFENLASIDGLSCNEKGVAEYIINYTRERDIRAFTDNSYVYTGSNTGNVIVEVAGGGENVLVAHMDTVRPTKKLKMSNDGDVIKSDGRTVLGADNRAGIAIILCAIEDYLQAGVSGEGFYAAFTACEETSLAGSRFLELPEQVKYAYVFDSYLRPGKVITSAFGALGFTVIIESNPALYQSDKNSPDAVAEEIIKNTPQGRINRETTLSVDLNAKLGTRTEKSVTTVIEGDIRSSASGRIEEQMHLLESLVKKVCKKRGCNFRIEKNWDFKPYSLLKESKVVSTAEKVINMAGLEFEELTSIGGSDANSLNERGIPAINFGIGAQNPHSYDEFIYLDDLKKSYEIVMNIMHYGSS